MPGTSALNFTNQRRASSIRPSGEVMSRKFLDIHTLAFALEGLVEDGLQLSEDALGDMHERLRAERQAQIAAGAPLAGPKV